MIFDGKTEAEKLRQELLASGKLNGKSLLILQADGSGQESTYVRLKRQMGESLGVGVRVEFITDSGQLRERLRGEMTENGVLVQLPIIGADKTETQRILDLIPEGKDVDGLNQCSKFLPAAVGAVEKVVEYARVAEKLRFATAAVVGAKGMVGRRIVRHLEERGFEVTGFDLGDDLARLVDYEMVVSATGTPGIIKGSMVKDGVIAIDLGYPQGDMVFDEVRAKAKLITPVPGGVGPLTVVCLFENLAQA